MKNLSITGFLVIALVVIIALVVGAEIMDDNPSGYTSRYRLRMYNQGARPGADSVNQNLKDIDSAIYMRDLRIDSAKTAISWMHNYPSGTWKRFDSTEFDNDTLKTKSNIFTKNSANNTLSGTNTITSGQLKFDGPGDAGSILNFIYTNDLGGVWIMKNNSDVLAKFDEGDGLYWQFPYPVTVTGDVDITGTYKVNGTPIASSSIDTNKYYSIYRLDSSKIVFSNRPRTITSPVTMSSASNSFAGDGGGITNLNAGAVVGRIDASNLPLSAFYTSNLDTSKIIFRDQRDTLKKKIFFADSAVYLGKTIYTKKALFSDTATFDGPVFSDVITADEVVASTIYSSSQIVGNEIICASFSNIGGPTNLYDLTVNHDAVFNGVILTGLTFQTGSTTKIGTTDNQNFEIMRDDTTKITITATGVSLSGVVVAAVLSVTGAATFNSTANFVGRVISNLLFEKGSTTNIGTYDNYDLNIKTNNTTRMIVDSAGDLRMYNYINNIKDTVLVKRVTGPGSYTYLRHNIANWRNIVSIAYTVVDDSSGRVLGPSYNASTGLSVGGVVFANDTAVNYFTPAGSVNLTTADTMKAIVRFQKIEQMIYNP